MLKLQLLLMFSICLCTVELAQCPIYDCSSDVADMKPQEGRAGATIKGDNKVHIQSCGKSSLVCPVSLTNTAGVKCVEETYPPWRIDLAPGDQCDSTDQGFKNNKCENGICKGKPGKSSCLYDKECDVGSHCLNKIGIPTIKVNEECNESRGEKCQFGSLCVDGTCKIYGSVQLQEQIPSLDYQDLCILFYAENAYNDNNKILCGYGPQIVGEDFKRPDPEDLICNYTAQYPDTGKNYYKIEYAKCGTNGDDAHYCPKFKGEKSFVDRAVKYRDMWQEHFKCHVDSNMVFGQDVIDRGYQKLMAKWATDKYETETDDSFPLIANNKDCLKNIVNRSYWQFDSKEDSASFYSKIWIGVTLIGLFITSF